MTVSAGDSCRSLLWTVAGTRNFSREVCVISSGKTRKEVTVEREFALPADIDADHVEASYRSGVLELMLPVKESAKPRRIAISTTDTKQLSAS